MDEELAKFPELVKIGREMLDAGKSTEEILAALRACSPSVIQSMKVMRDLLGVQMDEAKLLVHHSRTWSDMRDVFSEVHEIAEEEYGSVSEEGVGGIVQAKIDLDKKSAKTSSCRYERAGSDNTHNGRNLGSRERQTQRGQ